MKNKAIALTAAAIISAVTIAGVPKMEKLEGNQLVTYRDVVGIWTGCGGVTFGMKEGMRFTPEQCRQINKAEFETYAKHVYQETGSSNIPLLTAHALFSYNIGKGGYSRSQVLKEYRSGNLEKSCHAMMNWNGLTHNGVKYNCNLPQHINIKGCRGIVNRRTEEVRMCLEAVKMSLPEPCGFWCNLNK